MTNLQDLYLHTLETAPALHPVRRARIFRGLADIIGDEAFAADLIQRANECDELQRKDGQLALRLLVAINRPQT